MLKKFAELVHEIGPIYLIPYLIHLGMTLISGGRARIEAYLLMAQPVATKSFLPAHRGSSFSLVELGSNDPLLNQLPRPARNINSRFLQGAHCLATLKDDQLSGCIWLILDGYDEDTVRLHFQLPESGYCAWDFDVYVDPAHRMGPTFVKLWDGANAFLREREIHWTLSRISAFNRTSLSSHIRLGAKPIGNVMVLVLGPLEFMLSSCQPRLGISWKHQRIRLLLPNPAQ